jgi:hypothetical protein
VRVEVALAILAVGCGVPVDIGVLEDTTSGGSSGLVTDDATLTDSMTGPVVMTSVEMTSTTTVDSDSEDPPPPVQHDFALVEGPAVDTSTGGEEDTGGGGEMTTTVGTSASSTTGDTGPDDFEPGTLRIYATTGTATCDDPFGVEPCPATWTYRFSLPPDQQFVGASGRLEDNDGFATEVGGELVDCSFGGGSLFGSFEITAIDDTHVAGRMFDLEVTMWETEVVFDAAICPE